MIDYIIAFPDEATAQADPTVGPYCIDGNWRGDVCIPGVVVSTIADGQPIDALWRIIISTAARDAALEASPGCEMVADRDLAVAGAPRSQFILKSSVPDAEWPLLQVSPVFAGSNYPFGVE